MPESSSVTTIQPRSGPAASTRLTYWGWVIAATHPVWEMKYSTSAATLRMLVVTATAPTRAHAYQAMTASGQFSAWIRTLSPTPTPRPCRPAATERVASANSA